MPILMDGTWSGKDDEDSIRALIADEKFTRLGEDNLYGLKNVRTKDFLYKRCYNCYNGGQFVQTFTCNN